jgi:hypothetical protein
MARSSAQGAEVIDLEEFRRRREEKRGGESAPMAMAMPLAAAAAPVVWVPVWWFVPVWAAR